MSTVALTIDCSNGSQKCFSNIPWAKGADDSWGHSVEPENSPLFFSSLCSFNSSPPVVPVKPGYHLSHCQNFRDPLYR